MSEPVGAEEPVEDAGPPWVNGAIRRSAGWLIVAIVIGGVALLGVLEVLDRLSDIITMLLTALFLSLRVAAMSPFQVFTVARSSRSMGAFW